MNILCTAQFSLFFLSWILKEENETEKFTQDKSSFVNGFSTPSLVYLFFIPSEGFLESLSQGKEQPCLLVSLSVELYGTHSGPPDRFAPLSKEQESTGLIINMSHMPTRGRSGLAMIMPPASVTR